MGRSGRGDGCVGILRCAVVLLSLEALGGEGEEAAAFVFGQGVELVDEQETNGGEGGGPGRLGEEEGEALGGGDEDVGRFFALGGAVLGGGVAGAGGDADVGPV